MAIRAVFAPVAAVLLVGSMVFVGTASVLAYISYALAAYTLTIWCFQIPKIIHAWQAFKKENKYIRLWRDDTRLRVNASLYGSLVGNALYGGFHLWLGFYHHTVWFFSLGIYYLCLAVMRFFLLLHVRGYAPGERMKSELRKYRACGGVFLLMTLALAVIIFFMVYWNRTFEHHMITAIAMAAYTFAAFSVAIVNVVKSKRYNSPVFSASKAISFAAACVSMLTLTSTLLTTFSEGTMTVTEQKVMLGSVGLAVTGAVLAMALGMIVKGTKQLRKLKYEVEHGS